MLQGFVEFRSPRGAYDVSVVTCDYVFYVSNNPTHLAKKTCSRRAASYGSHSSTCERRLVRAPVTDASGYEKCLSTSNHGSNGGGSISAPRSRSRKWTSPRRHRKLLHYVIGQGYSIFFREIPDIFRRSQLMPRCLKFSLSIFFISAYFYTPSYYTIPSEHLKLLFRVFFGVIRPLRMK